MPAPSAPCPACRPSPRRSRRLASWLAFLGGLALLLPVPTSAIEPTRAEQSAASRWARTHLHFDSPASTSLFAFRYDGRSSVDCLKAWPAKTTRRKLDDARTEWTTVWTDPGSGLVVRQVAVEYADSPAVEWTVHVRNGGHATSSILEGLQAADVTLPTFGKTSPSRVVLHHAKGAPTQPDDYAPRSTPLNAGQSFRLATEGGRPSQTVMPYFNIAGDDGGVVCAVGWPGQWAAEFAVEGPGRVRLSAGQEGTRFRLEPGEEARTPLMALVFWQGPLDRAHNLWRRWMVDHNLPRPGGRLVPPHLVACSSHQFNEMLRADEANQIHFIDLYLAEGLKLDYWWMDAGWYVNDGSWVNTGTWEIDRRRFPNGLRAITDHAHARGLKSIVWFEPERVTTNSWLFREHPDWCLSAGPSSSRLLDLGNPVARNWLVEHVAGLLEREGIDLYRQDFNIDPLKFWHAHDAPDRRGLTENHYVSGYLAYWDALRDRRPGLLIDSCASGGRRNDLETLRRAVPFLRSDHLFEPVSQQSHTYGAAFWLPHHGTGTIVGPSELFRNLKPGEVDPYLFRSHMCPTVIACWDVRRADLDYARLRELTAQLRRIQPAYYGDYHPLTPYGMAPDLWMAWQFDLPDRGEGVVQAFRRSENRESTLVLKPRGLRPRARYVFENLDGGSEVRTGRQWMNDGLAVHLPRPASAAVFVYRRAN